jgi:hypothetical protein
MKKIKSHFYKKNTRMQTGMFKSRDGTLDTEIVDCNAGRILNWDSRIGVTFPNPSVEGTVLYPIWRDGVVELLMSDDKQIFRRDDVESERVCIPINTMNGVHIKNHKYNIEKLEVAARLGVDYKELRNIVFNRQLNGYIKTKKHSSKSLFYCPVDGEPQEFKSNIEASRELNISEAQISRFLKSGRVWKRKGTFKRHLNALPDYAWIPVTSPPGFFITSEGHVK